MLSLPLRSACITFVWAVSSLLVSSAAIAQGDLLYDVSATEVRVVNPLTATTVSTTPVVTTFANGLEGCYGLAIHPVTGVVYVILKQLNANPRWLATLDPATGTATLIAPLPDRYSGITFRRDGTLFGITALGANVPQTLYTIDTTTAVPTFAVSLAAGAPNFDTGAIVFAPDGFLYHSSGIGIPNVDEVLQRVDTQNGYTVTVVPLSGDDYDELLSIVPYTGTSLIAADYDDELFMITTGGRVTRIGVLDHVRVRGMVYVPTPNTLPFMRPFGDGCLHVTGTVPLLFGTGTPTIPSSVVLDLRFAPKLTFGALAFGFGTTALPFPSARCQVQIVPLFDGAITLLTSVHGESSYTLNIPSIVQPADIYLQSGILGFNEFVVSNPLQVHLR